MPVNIGFGVSVIKIDKDGKFEHVSCDVFAMVRSTMLAGPPKGWRKEERRGKCAMPIMELMSGCWI